MWIQLVQSPPPHAPRSGTFVFEDSVTKRRVTVRPSQGDRLIRFARYFGARPQNAAVAAKYLADRPLHAVRCAPSWFDDLVRADGRPAARVANAGAALLLRVRGARPRQRA